MLLPMPRSAVAEISLANHLALAVCRQGKGNFHQLYELTKTVYLVFYLSQARFGDISFEVLRDAEAGLRDAFDRAQDENIWSIDADTASLLQLVLSVYDEQLMSAPRWNVVDAGDRLTRFIEGRRDSPLSDYLQKKDGFDDANLKVSREPPLI
ncbi:hypothetical protein P3T18_000366 [Paraburkholderia sp. GAS199]|uniref:hypothetical protein n=1 Tax=Paraburkholderia sp. GAS199 TaxID=3035126 RepID=UPI003D21877E